MQKVRVSADCASKHAPVNLVSGFLIAALLPHLRIALKIFELYKTDFVEKVLMWNKAAVACNKIGDHKISETQTCMRDLYLAD